MVYKIGMRIVDARFLKSVDRYEGKGREPLPEICFIGRSNVGKSSMINTLVARKVARTSSIPGATRLINLYQVDYEFEGLKKSLIVSDFPGFGYARVPKEMREGWQQMIEAYIEDNRAITQIIWVFDVRREMDPLDEMLLEWLSANGIGFRLVLTKIDRETRSAVAQKKIRFQSVTGEGNPPLLFSAKDGQGKHELLSHIARSAKSTFSRD